MKMGQKLLASLLFLALVFGVARHSNKAPALQIGILQTASHPALDAARDGFIEELEQKSAQPVSFVLQNAEGSLSQAQTIAGRFHAHGSIKAIYAIGSTAVLAASKAEKEKPIFVAAISDPKTLNLTEASNICGTTDSVDLEAQADLIIQLLPECKRVAIPLSPSEPNSAAMARGMLAALEKRGLTARLFPVQTTQELAQVLKLACEKSNLLLLPNDNLLSSSITFITKQALIWKTPVIASDILLVEQGVLAALGANYKNLGRETAQIALEVLSKTKKAETIGICPPRESTIFINGEVAKIFSIAIPSSLNATIVENRDRL